MSSSASKELSGQEAYLRQCLETQTIDYLLSKPACFNLLAVGEDGLGKVTFLETLFGVKATALRESKARTASTISSADISREFPVQIFTERLSLGSGIAVGSSTDAASSTSSLSDQQLSSSTGKLTVRLMTTVNYAVGESNRSPWTTVTDFLAKQVTSYVNSRAASPFDFRPEEDDERVHCCLYFLPPMGSRGLRRCDALALKCLDDKVNLVPVLAKADSYTADELADRKASVAADLQRFGIAVHQFLLPARQHPPQQQQQQSPAAASSSTPAAFGQRVLAAPLAVMGAPHPDTARSLPWGCVGVEDERYSDVSAVRRLIVERNMLILRKTTKKFHSSIQKSKLAATLPRK